MRKFYGTKIPSAFGKLGHISPLNLTSRCFKHLQVSGNSRFEITYLDVGKDGIVNQKR